MRGDFMTNVEKSLNQEYIDKLDQIIYFFKHKKETDLSFLLMGKEESKFYYSLFISLFALLIVLISTLSNLEKFPDDFIAIFILAMLILLMAYLYIDNIYSKRRTKKLIHQSVRFNEILNFLQSLKILPYQVDLFPLINVIKRNYHVVTWVKFLNEDKYVSDIWYDEIFDCLTNINNEIIEKDNLK